MHAVMFFYLMLQKYNKKEKGKIPAEISKEKMKIIGMKDTHTSVKNFLIKNSVEQFDIFTLYFMPCP